MAIVFRTIIGGPALVCGGPALVWHFFCVGVTGAGAGQGSSLERAPARLAICGPGMEDEPCRLQPVDPWLAPLVHIL